MKRFVLGIMTTLSLIASPAVAQIDKQEDETDEAVVEMLSGMFSDMYPDAEPLTSQQEARLPVAMQVVSKLMPEGLYAQMMDESMRPMMDGMMGDLANAPILLLAQTTGMDITELNGLDEKRLAEAAALLDPDAEKRSTETTAAFIEMITEVMNEIEPAYRAGLARAYAVRFTKAELLDLNAYFETPVGAKYAGESFLIFTDPQVMSTMNEMMPVMMERMPQMMESITEITEKYDTARAVSQLTDGERSRLADLLGVSVEELEASAPPADDGDEIEAVFEEA